MRNTILLVLWLQAFFLYGQDDLLNPYAGSDQAVDAGRNLYLQSCSGCHGANAEGGRGPRLHNYGKIRSAPNRQLFDSIKNGVRGSDMPPTPLPDEKLWQLLTFVRSLNLPASETKIAGDVENGRLLFEGKGGCRSCHKLNNKGGYLGPDLTNVGNTHNVAQIREGILDPNLRPTKGFAGVSVTTLAGKTITGIAKNSTNYSMQIIDEQGNLHLLETRNLKAINWRRTSLMPDDYSTRLTKTELLDLLAFLGKQVAHGD